MGSRISDNDFFPFSSIVVFDTETTGLDFQRDAILEIGMIRLNRDGSEEKLSTLFDPQRPIPRAISLLTGIRPEDCAGQPLLQDKISDLFDFVDGGWVVGHNVEFDLRFMNAAGERHLSGRAFADPSKILDTLELSRMLNPWMPNHRLETLGGFYMLPKNRQHRALDDAETTAAAFRGMLASLLELDPSSVATVRRILNGASDGLRFLFDALGGRVPSRSAAKPFRHPDSMNILGERVPSGPDTEAGLNKIDPDEIVRSFESGGALSIAVPGFMTRKPQSEMAFSVARALNQDAFLVAEAGTGVGKSLSYLVPVASWVQRNPGDRVVIATHTKTLQDQLFFKDIPQVLNAFGKPFSSVLLKGRGNYLCLARFQNLLDHLDEKMPDASRRKLLPLVPWSAQTRTGDIEENPGFQRDANDSVWSMVNSESVWCLGPRCPHESACFVQKVHRAARSCNVVVVNHALLFSSLAANRSVLGDFETLIVDEAHQIEKVASQYLGILLHQGLFTEIVHWLHAQKPSETGLLVSLRRLVSQAAPDLISSPDFSVLARIQSLTQDLNDASHGFFQKLAALPVFALSERPRSNRTRSRIRQSLAPMMPAAFDRLENVIDQLRFALADSMNQLKLRSLDEHPDGEPVCRELEICDGKLAAVQESLAHFKKADFTRHAVWCEFVDKDQKRESFLHSVPIDVAGLLANKLYPRLKRGVLTSATLTVGESFDYLLYRWGLRWVEADRVMTRVFGSPFNFAEQALLLVPTYLANPRESRFSSDLAGLLQRLLTEHPRGTMVLFTSYALLQEVYDAVRPALEEKGIRLLGQGIDGSRTLLLRTFQEDVRSVLFGTASFWEGVDVPGQALELLVITKIPFDVPTDPLIEARMEKCQAETGNGFLNYAVPEAIVRLRQGFGRLIRSTEDRGAVLMLDQRVTQTAYGGIFLKSLPVDARLCADERTLFSELKKWFNS
jgi:ATP-dependent DNA helicase DinG